MNSFHKPIKHVSKNFFCCFFAIYIFLILHSIFFIYIPGKNAFLAMDCKQIDFESIVHVLYIFSHKHIILHLYNSHNCIFN